MVFSKEVVESSVKGYFKIPMLEGYGISLDGIILDIEANLEVKQHSSGGYNYISLNNISYAIHILVADTFISKVGFNDDALVNHKDGNKGRNHYSNLEWTTYSGNIIHAYSTGLRSDNTNLLVKDLRTNDIFKFYSIGECSRFFRTSPSRIFNILRLRSYGKPCFNFYIIIRDGEVFPNVGPEIIGLYKESQNRRVYVEINNDPEIKRIIFPNLLQTAEHLNIEVDRLKASMKKERERDNVYFHESNFKIAYFDEVITSIKAPVETIGLARYNYTRKIRKPKRISVTDLSNGSVSEVESLGVLASRLGVKKSAIQKYIHVNKGIWKNKLHIKYLH